MNKYKLLSIAAVLIFGCEPQRSAALEQPATPETSQDAAQSTGVAVESSRPYDAPETTSEAQAKATELTGKVVKILDGDTIDILTLDKATIRIRLNGIDAPETGQPFGKTAKEFLVRKSAVILCALSVMERIDTGGPLAKYSRQKQERC